MELTVHRPQVGNGHQGILDLGSTPGSAPVRRAPASPAAGGGAPSGTCVGAGMPEAVSRHRLLEIHHPGVLAHHRPRVGLMPRFLAVDAAVE